MRPLVGPELVTSGPGDLRIMPISPVFGAEIHGVDLASGIDDETFALVHRAWLDHGVVAFRGQSPLTAEVQVEFAQRIGPLHTHPAAPAEHENAAVFVIRTHRDSPISNGNGWHSDVSCDEEPPSATMLQVQLLPTAGAATPFSPIWRLPTPPCLPPPESGCAACRPSTPQTTCTRGVTPI